MPVKAITDLVKDSSGILYLERYPRTGSLIAKPRVSLTVPNHDHSAQVSLTVLDIFWMQLPKVKTNSQIYSTESQASFTDKEFFSFGNGI